MDQTFLTIWRLKR